jgi:hypothetical protein
MGKAQKKKKTQAWRHNPIRVPDSHLPAGKGEGSADPSKEKQTVPVLAKVRPPPILFQAITGDAELML